jgi:hypothetical protein
MAGVSTDQTESVSNIVGEDFLRTRIKRPEHLAGECLNPVSFAVFYF